MWYIVRKTIITQQFCKYCTSNESCLAMLVHAYICVNVHVHVCHFYLQARKNREIAHLQRKIDEVPSRAELTQYQQRFIELFGQGRLVDISLLNLSCFLHCFFLIFLSLILLLLDTSSTSMLHFSLPSLVYLSLSLYSFTFSLLSLVYLSLFSYYFFFSSSFSICYAHWNTTVLHTIQLPGGSESIHGERGESKHASACIFWELVGLEYMYSLQW